MAESMRYIRDKSVLYDKFFRYSTCPSDSDLRRFRVIIFLDRLTIQYLLCNGNDGFVSLKILPL